MKTFKQLIKEMEQLLYQEEMTGSKITKSLPGQGISVQDRKFKTTKSSNYGNEMSLIQKDPKNYNYNQDSISSVKTPPGGKVQSYESDHLSRQSNHTKDNATAAKEKILNISKGNPNRQRISSETKIKTSETNKK